MAVAKKGKPITDVHPEIQRKEVLPPPRPIAVDTKYEPRKSLLQHVSGARWIVDYYKQVKTSEEASEAFNVNRPVPYQQYIKIERFEIKVTTPMQYSPDTDNQSATMIGTGLIYPSIVPDVGDTFIADIGDGRAGYLNIKEVTQLSHLKDTVYEIEYEVIDWLDYETRKKLDEKVVKVMHYERSYADYGANPILDEEEHGLYKHLFTWRKRILSHYFSLFYSHEYDTVLLPTSGSVTYDPFLVEFLTRIWSDTDHPTMLRLRIYNRDNAHRLNIRTIWDVITEMNPLLLLTVSKQFGLVPKSLFHTGLPMLMGITYSRIEYIYHPIEVKDVQKQTYTVPMIGELKATGNYPEYSGARTLTLPITKLPGIGFVHPALKDNITDAPDAKKYGQFNTYVLSPDFYNRDRSKMSKVERMLDDVLNCKPINAKDLIPILDQCTEWGSLEQCYYIPVLYALATIALGDLVQ